MVMMYGKNEQTVGNSLYEVSRIYQLNRIVHGYGWMSLGL